MDKKNILICGLPNNVLRIFIENINSHYNVFFISYSKDFQYKKIKKILGKNTFLIADNSPVNLLRFVFILLKTLLPNDIKISIAFHNHFIKNGIYLILTKCFFPKITRIYFPYDIAPYTIPKNLKNTLKSKLALFFDKICFLTCHKIITKGFKDDLNYLEKSYKIHKKSHFVFNFLIERKDTANKKVETFRKEGIVHLVSIGGVKNPAIGDNNYIIIKELLNEKKIVLHVYSHTSELLNELKYNNNLCIHPYVKDHNKFIKEISKYDFGVSISFPLKSDLIQAKMASGIRVYDYLSAGIPIIIDEEHTLMANMIVENNFGLIIPLKEVKNIINYINKCDYKHLINSVKKNREKYFVETNINKLLAFLER